MFDRLRMMVRIYKMKSPRVAAVEGGYIELDVAGGLVCISELGTDNLKRPTVQVYVKVSSLETHQLCRDVKDFFPRKRVAVIQLSKLKSPRRQRKQKEEAHETENSGTAD